jgi:hypothetical protein
MLRISLFCYKKGTVLPGYSLQTRVCKQQECPGAHEDKEAYSYGSNGASRDHAGRAHDQIYEEIGHQGQ